MAQLYVTDPKAVVGIDKGRIEVKYGDGMLHYLPIENVDGITIMGNPQVTTRCISQCLIRGIAVQYYSSKGSYFGKLSSTQHVNTKRQRQQIKLTEDEDFVLDLAKIIITAKINNQLVVLRRYQRGTGININHEMTILKRGEEKVNKSESLPEILGYEGSCARSYFQGLGKLINVDDFRFNGRSRRPPKDPFNSMLSLGYAILMNDMYGAIEGRGLSPYFGFIHKDKEKHPTLSSDLIEEWRAVLIDTLVMALVNGHEIGIENFYSYDGREGVFIDREGLKIFIKKIENRMDRYTKYLDYIDYPVSFRKAIDLQVMQLCRAIEEKDPGRYKPIKIR